MRRRACGVKIAAGTHTVAADGAAHLVALKTLREVRLLSEVYEVRERAVVSARGLESLRTELRIVPF